MEQLEEDHELWIENTRNQLESHYKKVVEVKTETWALGLTLLKLSTLKESGILLKPEKGDWDVIIIKSMVMFISM